MSEQVKGHTPGPWVATLEGDWWMVLTVASHATDDGEEDGPIPVVDLHHGGYDWSDLGLGSIEANARLIAAAPDMLEALQGVLPLLEEVEGERLVGDEGCLWPVEAVRAALSRTGAA